MKNHGAFGNFDEARDLGRTTPSYTVTNGTVVASSSVGLYVTGAHAAVDVFGVVSGLGGVLLNGEYASLTNTGTITGVSSYGVDLSGGHGTLINKGVISSGHYGTGAELSGGGMENTGTIDGGGGAYHGGIGIDLSNGIFSNGGTIAGGDTTTTIFGAQAFGGYGAGVTNGTLHNSGLIEGGAGNDGGAGVELDAAKLVNTGTILGGIVKYLFGGTGVAMSNESVLVNHGVIAGSTSQYGDGDGVFLNGGTLTNSGTISASAAAAPADAIRFGSQASTLIIDPGAVFDGTVAANGSNDRLILAKGALAGTMSGLGGQFTGFTTILENAGAHWDISGANTLGADTVFSDAGWLRVSGSLIDNGVIDLSANAVLGVSGAAEVAIGSLNLSGGALLGSQWGLGILRGRCVPGRFRWRRGR